MPLEREAKGLSFRAESENLPRMQDLSLPLEVTIAPFVNWSQL